MMCRPSNVISCSRDVGSISEYPLRITTPGDDKVRRDHGVRSAGTGQITEMLAIATIVDHGRGAAGWEEQLLVGKQHVTLHGLLDGLPQHAGSRGRIEADQERSFALGK